jgi:hypothetical protein
VFVIENMIEIIIYHPYRIGGTFTIAAAAIDAEVGMDYSLASFDPQRLGRTHLHTV